MSTLRLYKTYNFVDKDPVIDELRTIHQNSGFSYEDVADISGVCPTTFYNWFNGATKRPQYATIIAAARAYGYDYKLIKMKETNKKPVLKLIKGKKTA